MVLTIGLLKGEDVKMNLFVHNKQKRIISKIFACIIIGIAFFMLFGKTTQISAEEMEDDYFSFEQTIDEGRIMTVDNDIVYVQKDLTIEYGAELIFSGDCYLEDDIYVKSGGVLTINNELINAGKIYLEDGASLNINANLVNNGEIFNYGDVLINGSVVNYASLANYNNIEIAQKAELTNSGDITGNGLLTVKGEFNNVGSYLSGSIFVENILDNKGSILLEKANLNNRGEINNYSYGRISLVKGCFYNESSAAKVINEGNIDTSNDSKIYNQGYVEVGAEGHLDILDFCNYNELDNHGHFVIYGVFDSRNGKLVNYGDLENPGSMNFTYYSDFEQSKDSTYTGNMYECVYSYGATAIFNGSLAGYVVVSLASIAVCLIVVRIRIVKKAKKEKSGD
ncbi:MAG: hypothetical protein E7242_05655 [Lachnospiraceae bacterium]|nr:hypothetical protein [Lachnospiraceae bacterium]